MCLCIFVILLGAANDSFNFSFFSKFFRFYNFFCFCAVFFSLVFIYAVILFVINRYFTTFLLTNFITEAQALLLVILAKAFPTNILNLKITETVTIYAFPNGVALAYLFHLPFFNSQHLLHGCSLTKLSETNL